MLTFAHGRVPSPRIESDSLAFDLKEFIQSSISAKYIWAARKGDTQQSAYALTGDRLQFAAFSDVNILQDNALWLSALLAADSLNVEQTTALLRSEPDEN